MAASANPRVVLALDAPLRPGSWYTIVAGVEDLAGNPFTSQGDLGPGSDEPDRLDVAFLPADVDQSGVLAPLDLLRFRQLLAGSGTATQAWAGAALDAARP